MAAGTYISAHVTVEALDLDDVCAHVGEGCGGEGAHDHGSQIDDAQTMKSAGCEFH
ncbi:hypothetical protein [Rhodococcus sp. JVH1]|uniref:hypothetical protein n=1 Tax=Rhodococcus sp. JVH1 TaxID=745408 RepID=UPI00352435AD